MNYLVPSLLFALGLVLIIKGGDWFVDAAGWIAEVSGMPRFLIGATVVSFATTLPELITSVLAAMDGSVDMAVGNAVGSVTANTGMIMGISIVAMPMVINRRQNAPKMLLLLAACGGLWALCATGSLTFTEGLILLGVFALFVIENIVSAKREAAMDTEMGTRPPKPTGGVIGKNILLFIVGAAGIVIGANLLVDNGTTLATLLGVPEAVIAATMVAIGTSLPELVTTLTAIAKKQASLSIGNIVGANIIDLTLILPICSMITGGELPMSSQGLSLDMPFCFGITCLALIPTLIFGKFKRIQGVAMLAAYAAYIALMLVRM